MDETGRRIHAEAMVREYRRDMGQHLMAAACYVSAAHGHADAQHQNAVVAFSGPWQAPYRLPPILPIHASRRPFAWGEARAR